jgi:hypothetical protein
MNPRQLAPGIVTVLFGLSWFIYSPIHFEAFNADYALHPLMAEDLVLPEDMYIWGENRIGSLIPFLARPLVVAFGLSGMWAVSIVQYFLLALLVWIWYKRFNSPWLAVAFSAFLLIPAFSFHAIIMVSHPLTVFVLVLTMNTMLFERVERQIDTGSYRLRELYIWFFVVLISLWTTEQIAVPIGIMWMILVWKSIDWKSRTIRVSKKHFYTGLLMPLPALIIWGGYMRNLFRARRKANYGKFCSFEELTDQLGIIGNRLYKVFTFQHFDAFSILSWLLLIGALFALFHHRIYRERLSNTARVFLYSSAILLVITITSKWVYVNHTGIRYFVPVIFMFMIYVLYVIDHYQLVVLRITAPVILLFGSFSGYLQIQDFVHRNLPEVEKRDTVESIDVKPNSIFIGDYWYAYLAGALRSDQLYAFPYPWQEQRNKRQLNHISKSDEVIIAKGEGLPELSDTVQLHGFQFSSNREIEKTGRLVYRRYRVLPD